MQVVELNYLLTLYSLSDLFPKKRGALVHRERTCLASMCRHPEGVPLSTADGNVLLHPIGATSSNAEALPPKDEVANVCADEDTDDEISIVVHGEQHDEVRNSKLQHMQKRTDSLLQNCRAETLRSK